MTRTQASFTTYVGERPHTRGIVVDRRNSAGDLSPLDFTALAFAAHRPDAIAFGKVAVIRSDGISVTQTNLLGVTAQAFCGNATAAALSVICKDGVCRSTVSAGEKSYEVRAEVRAGSVTQTWLVPRTRVIERSWRDRRVLLVDTLNPYALIIGTLPDSIDAETARHELLGDSLAAKLAVISQHTIEFYNANGRHGAAPQTGIASMALAARLVPWFAEQMLGMPSLPVIKETKDDRLAIAMPRVTVELSALALSVAA